MRCLLLAALAAVVLLGGLSCVSNSPQPGPEAGPGLADQALLSRLQDALDAQLAAQGGKGLADVTGELVDCSCSFDGPDASVTWTYNNTGDYDRNSEVNASDLVPIALNFGVTSADIKWPYAEVADGDGNGEVNIADVTPIGINFGSVVANYVVEADIDGAGDWQPVANVPFAAGEVPLGGSLLRFQGTVPNGAMLGDTERFRAFAGPPADPLYEIQPPNWSATISVAPLSGYAPLAVEGLVEFDGSGGPFTVELDYGDGVGTYFGNSADGTPVNFSYIFEDPGTYNITGTATNTGEGGALPLAEQVEVLEFAGDPALNPSNWSEIVISPANANWGMHHAAALLNGKPAVVYTRDDRDEIYFAHASVPRPLDPADWVSGVVDDRDNLGGTLSLCEVDSIPCVSYEDTTMQDVYVAIAHNSEPAGVVDWDIHQPDDLAIGQMQLTEIGDNLRAVYRRGGSVMYAADIVVGYPMWPADWELIELDTGEQYDYLQLAEVDGCPAVAYQRKDGGFNELVYAQAGGSDPAVSSDFNSLVIDDMNTNSGNWISLSTNALGHPVLAYTNVDIVHFLKYAYADGVDGPAANWTAVTVYQQAQTHLGNWLGLVSYDNRALMSYIETGSGASDGLHVAYATVADPTGPGDFDRAILDPGGTYFVNEETELILLADGTPAVFYRTSVGLKYIYFTPPD